MFVSTDIGLVLSYWFALGLIYYLVRSGNQGMLHLQINIYHHHRMLVHGCKTLNPLESFFGSLLLYLYQPTKFDPANGYNLRVLRCVTVIPASVPWWVRV